jgi:hypothetical protein
MKTETCVNNTILFVNLDVRVFGFTALSSNRSCVSYFKLAMRFPSKPCTALRKTWSFHFH